MRGTTTKAREAKKIVTLLEATRKNLASHSPDVGEAVKKIDSALDQLGTPDKTPLKNLNAPRIYTGKWRSPKSLRVLQAIGDGRLKIDGCTTSEITQKLKEIFSGGFWTDGSVSEMCKGFARQNILKVKYSQNQPAKWFLNDRLKKFLKNYN